MMKKCILFFTAVIITFGVIRFAEAQGFIIPKKNLKKEPSLVISEKNREVPQREEQVLSKSSPADAEFLKDYGKDQEIDRLKKVLSQKQREVDALKQALEKSDNAKKEYETRVGYLQTKEEHVYQVKKGDSLWKISKRRDIYNNPLQWIKIYNANMDRIQDPNLIYPGQLFRIPE